MSGGRRAHRGFVLLPVLWVLVTVTMIWLGVMLVARDAVAASRNRVNHERASWIAEGCLELARSAIDESLASSHGANDAWETLDRQIDSLALPHECTLVANPSGLTLDVNSATPAELLAVLAGCGVPPYRADSLVDALLDWRDTDDIERPFGAEKPWYSLSHSLPPRNGPLAAVAELSQVRGFSDELRRNPTLERLLGVEPGLIFVRHAPLALLATLPGVGQEALARIAIRRAVGDSVSDLALIAPELSGPARAEMLQRQDEWSLRVTPSPEAWILDVEASSGAPPIRASLEIRVALAGSRAAIIRRRGGP
jgi:general secretion pathway protein K